MIIFAQRLGSGRQALFLCFQESIAQRGKKNSRLKFYAIILQLIISATEGIVQSYFPTTGKKDVLKEGIFSIISDCAVIYRFCFPFFQL